MKRGLAALVTTGMVLGASMAGADCGADHKAATPPKSAATATKSDKSGDKPTTVVVGAPGHPVEVSAPSTESVSAVGGSGAPGKAGAAGKPAQ